MILAKNNNTPTETLPILIIGSGIAGMVLALELHFQNIPFLMASDPQLPKATYAAGALLNYFNPKRNKVNSSDKEYYSLAENWYKKAERVLQTELLSPQYLTYQDVESGKCAEHKCLYLNIRLMHDRFHHFFQPYIQPAKVCSEDIQILEDGVLWKNQKFSAAVYCIGAAARKDPLWQHLPFTANRGEALIVSFQKNHFEKVMQIDEYKLLPLGNGQYWYGARHQWYFDDLTPDESWRTVQIEKLSQVFNDQPHVIEHLCAERPTTAGQQCILDFHPHYSRIAIITGLGSKGMLRAPALIPDFAQTCIHRFLDTR